MLKLSLLAAAAVLAPLTVVAQDSHLRGLLDPRSVLMKEEHSCQVKPDVEKMSQHFEDEIVFEKFFANPPRCGGTILEIGGFDGKTLSNSWFFEFALGWKSILIEAFPKNFEQMVQNRPDAINVHGAMCFGESIEFTIGVHPATGGTTHDMNAWHSEKFTNDKTGLVTVPCKSVAGILQENRISNIDVFFVDVEGAELTVLTTIDWTAVTIGMFIVEMNGTDPNKDEAVRAVLKAHGYVKPFRFLDECLKRKENCVNNEIFALPDYIQSITTQA